MTTDSGLTSKLAIALALCCVGGLVALIPTLFPLPLGAVGTTDFVQYWSAWHVILDGGNCYDAGAVYALQSSLADKNPPLISWNPPWTFTLLSPLLLFPFEQSATLWFLAQILLLGVIISTVPQAFSLPKLLPIPGALIVTVFFPVLSSMYWGQLGILLAASVSLFLFFQQRRSFFLAGVALLPLTMKPHLFLLFIPPGIRWIKQMPRKDRVRFLLGSLGGFLILAAITLSLAPASISSWLHGFSSSSATAGEHLRVHFDNWQTATVATWIRIAIHSSTNVIPRWPLIALPVLGLLASVTYFLVHREAVKWTKITPPLLCLSLLTSNYGWVYDQSLLIVCQIVLICGAVYYASQRSRYCMFFTALLIQIVALALSQSVDPPQHYFAWIPLAMLILLIADERMRRKQRQNVDLTRGEES